MSNGPAAARPPDRGMDAPGDAGRDPASTGSIAEEFARRRRRQTLVAVPFIGLIVLLAIKRSSDDPSLLGLAPHVWAPFALVFVLGALAFSYFNWRCPACGAYLGRVLNPRHCVSCGAALRS